MVRSAGRSKGVKWEVFSQWENEEKAALAQSAQEGKEERTNERAPMRFDRKEGKRNIV